MGTDSSEVRSEELKSVLRQVARAARRRMISNCSGLADVAPVSATVWIQDRADWRIPELLYEEMWHRIPNNSPWADSLSRPPNIDMERHTRVGWRVGTCQKKVSRFR